MWALLEAVGTFASEYGNWIGAFATVVSGIAYSNYAEKRSVVQVLVCWTIVTLVFFVFFANTILPKKSIDVWQAISFLLMFGAALYAGLCDLFRFGLAAHLTSKRGEKWIKELDYCYLAFGVCAVVSSVFKMDLPGGKVTGPDLLTPLSAIVAMVIRLIKTRAEIDGWNQPEKGYASEA